MMRMVKRKSKNKPTSVVASVAGAAAGAAAGASAVGAGAAAGVAALLSLPTVLGEAGNASLILAMQVAQMGRRSFSPLLWRCTFFKHDRQYSVL